MYTAITAQTKQMEAAIAELTKQRDELREALSMIYNSMDSCIELTPEALIKAKIALSITN